MCNHVHVYKLSAIDFSSVLHLKKFLFTYFSVYFTLYFHPLVLKKIVVLVAIVDTCKRISLCIPA